MQLTEVLCSQYKETETGYIQETSLLSLQFWPVQFDTAMKASKQMMPIKNEEGMNETIRFFLRERSNRYVEVAGV